MFERLKWNWSGGINNCDQWERIHWTHYNHTLPPSVWTSNLRIYLCILASSVRLTLLLTAENIELMHEQYLRSAVSISGCKAPSGQLIYPPISPLPHCSPLLTAFLWTLQDIQMVRSPDLAQDNFPQRLKRKFWSQSSSNLVVWFLSFAHVLIFLHSLFPIVFLRFAPSPLHLRLASCFWDKLMIFKMLWFITTNPLL